MKTHKMNDFFNKKIKYQQGINGFLTVFNSINNNKDLESLIRTAPTNLKDIRDKAQIAAIVRLLCAQKKIRKPNWIDFKTYISPEPIYAFENLDQEGKNYFRKVAPKEFKFHNVFSEANSIKRA